MSMTIAERLEVLQQEMDKLSPDEFYKKLFGYSENEYDLYLENKFYEDVAIVADLVHNGTLDYEDCPVKGNMFYRAMREQSHLTEVEDDFPTDLYDMVGQGVRMRCIYGQGTLTTFEKL